ncbi:MAG: amino acid decarboxylase [Lachnospiraceae bacterium]|nr:amino acid decarboxylase [Lachnospiraceae bacterium]
MKTPIYDFVQSYAKSGISRLHMPGHKGCGPLGAEPFDITEIAGADSLYEAEGIIAQSERNASALFGTGYTFYSTEGSSQCIRAMLFLALLHWKERNPAAVRAGIRPVVAAARNAHKTFLTAAALLDLDVVWLWPEEKKESMSAGCFAVFPDAGSGISSLCSCPVSPAGLRAALAALPVPPAAVYLTSPDYLGGTQDIAALAAQAHAFNTLLLVDNAHGAYLHFLPVPAHPIDLGADLCCDSAHKTLPVLTGGAYLHISVAAPERLRGCARQALALFGSTSPSYLILQSLDLANRYLADGFPERLAACTAQLEEMRSMLRRLGWQAEETEPLKVTIAASRCGWSGMELSDRLRAHGIECEYADPDFLVLMFTPENPAADRGRLLSCMRDIPVGPSLHRAAPSFPPPRRSCSIREAVLSPHETVPVAAAAGRVMGPPTVHCPPAIPVVVSGEEINADAIPALEYYGICEAEVMRELTPGNNIPKSANAACFP